MSVVKDSYEHIFVQKPSPAGYIFFRIITFETSDVYHYCLLKPIDIGSIKLSSTLQLCRITFFTKFEHDCIVVQEHYMFEHPSYRCYNWRKS